ncbi:MAG: hypothetical protein ACI8XB_001730 [Patiriisocius sp.]|jgi:uncharacterized protein YfaS (alpha-2-macroglobulin family)
MNRIVISILAGMLLLLNACQKKQESSVNIVGTNFHEEVPELFNFEFQFDRSMANDTLLKVRIDEELLNFNPPINGTFNWSTEDVLQFIPAKKLKPATHYTVKIGKDYDQFFKGTKIDKSWAKKFHTPLLSIEDVEGYWGADQNNVKLPGMHAMLRFNHQVNPNDLGGNLAIVVDNQQQSFVVSEQRASRTINIYLPQVKVEDKKYLIDFNFKKELKPAIGNLSLASDLEFSKYLNSPFVMDINGLKGEHNGLEGNIKIFTSQKVSEEELRKHLVLEPNVKYTVEILEQEVKIISDQFDAELGYHVKVKKGLKGIYGGSLKNDFEEDASFGELNPSIAFLDKKNVYLSKDGNRNIEVNIINVKKVKMTVYRVYENNIMQFFNNRGYYDDYYYHDRYDSYSGDKNQVGCMGDIVYEEEIVTKNLPTKGANKLLGINFKDKIPNADGLYQIVLSSNENYWLQSKKTIAISDIGLIVKKGPNSISVFANSIHTAAPISGVELTLIGKNNQITKSQKTDGSGKVVFKIEELLGVNYETAMITARLGSDYNYIMLNKTQVSTSRYDVGGHWQNTTGLMTYIYPERDIYRPGEKLNVSTIIRDYQWETPDAFPLIFKLTSPNGKEVGSVRKKLNDEGSAEASFDLSASAATGSYMLTVLTASDVVLQNSYIKVEEFVPDRIKVDTKMNKEEFANGDELTLEINAANLFGTPASNRNWESELQISRAYFYVPEYNDYNFSINQNYTYFKNVMETGKTDENGTANVSFEIPEAYANMGVLNARTYTTVFDETGRPVNRNNSSKIHTQDYYYGIGHNGYYHRTSKPVISKLIAVDQDKKAANSVEATVTLIRHEYKSVLSQSGRYYRYHSVPKEVILEEKTVTLSGDKNTYSFTPDFSGKYEVRVSKPGVTNHVSKIYYCYGWGNTNNSSFKVDNEGSIDIKTDKEKYNVGEKANIIMSLPFSGKTLITIESDKVVKHFYKESDKKSLSMELKITEDMLPNIYISATLFRPHAISDLPLTVAHGYAPIIVNDERRNIPLEINAVASTRSKTKQKITVKGKPNSMVSLAVVDEGILQVTGFKTPNPFDYFYQKRALQMTSHDIYPYLFPEVGLHSGRPGGGDGDSELEKRLNPMKNKRFKLVSFWSGILETNGKGEVEYEIDIPQFSGSLRIMVVNYKGKNFGSAEKNMIVADPIILSAGIPRFLSPGDTLIMPLTITNTTKNATNGEVNIVLEGPLSLVPEENNSVELKANSEGRKVFRIAVAKELGESKIIAKVNALGETFILETDITVRPGSPLQKRSGSGTIAANSIKKLSLDEKGFLPKTVGRKLIVSSSPLVKFTKDIEYLVRYPHGCVEQTVSKAFPQLYFEDIIKDMGIYSDRSENARYNVKQAINKLQRMQLYDGAYTYWPGSGRPHYWGSVSATHFLLEAKIAGYDVNERMLSLSLDNLGMRMKDKKRVDYYYNGNSRRKIIPKSSLYATYILALANKADRSMMNYYKANKKDLSLDCQYLLAGAYQLIGDEKSFYEVLPKSFEGERSNQSTGGSFYSYIRDEALSLNVLMDTDPENPQVPIMVKHVSEQMSSKRYLNTQERLFGFLAMGKFARKNNGNNVRAKVKNGGEVVADFKGKMITLDKNKLISKDIEIVAEGEGELFYFYETEGIDEKGNYKEEDSFMRVRKAFFTRTGTPITNNKFKQNDLIVVRIAISAQNSTRIQNVAISDILPAGFEIENPRLDDLPQYKWIRRKSYPQYQDIRDDRINMYTDVTEKTKYFFYMVRAVSPGKYYMGPVGADAMYNGEYHSYNGAAWIEIGE